MAESKIDLSSSTAQVQEIRAACDVAEARRMVAAIVDSIGVESKFREEVVLAVSELGSNLVKHARGGGKLIFTRLGESDRLGIQIDSEDSGPGIASIDEALADGFSSKGSLGSGLGTVNRLMDELEIDSRPGKGTHMRCRKWIHNHARSLRDCPLDFGVASRPHPLCEINGDTFVVKRWAENVLVGVIDGLGHGPLAHRAAQSARHYVETHFNQPLADIFRGTNRACRGTRGVVMALACFDWAKGEVSFASIGNIEARVFGNESFSPKIRRGIVGINAPAAIVTTYPWSSATHVLVMHSDGLDHHWRKEDFATALNKPADAVARKLLNTLGKKDDDATVLVVKQKEEDGPASL